MSDIDQIDDIIENSAELTSKQKGPLRWAVRKVREELSASPQPYRRPESRFDSHNGQTVDGQDIPDTADPFAEDIPF